MIEEVADLIKDEIKTSLRGTFDNLHKHKYSYTLQVCRNTLKRNLLDAYREYQKSFTKREIKDMDRMLHTSHQELSGGGFDKAFTEAAEKGVKDYMLSKTNVASVWISTFRGVVTILPTDIVSTQGGNRIDINLAKGVTKASKMTGGAKPVPYNLVNSCTKKLYKQARGAAFRQLAFYCDEAGKRMKNPDGKTMRGASSEVNPIKGHGEAMEAFGSKEIRPKSGKRQTTVAVLAMAKNFKNMKRVSVTGKYEKEILKQVSVVRSMITNNLDVKFDLKQYRNVSNTEFDEDLVVDLHATDSKGNSEFAKGKYDLSGIKKHIDSYVRNSVKPALMAGLTKKSKEWVEMKGSTSKKDLIVRQQQKMLIEKLLKIKGTRPDFRLKVNKRLLKQATDAKVRGKKSKEKSIRGASSKTSKAYIAASRGVRARPKTGKSIEEAKTTQSPIALRNLLNEMLPQMVASKMTSPALQFRTGRFANSARVENVDVGPRGGIGIDYTYMRDPYETFEPGNKQGSVQRDPRKIIGASIRELAIGILGKQPTTIRRN